MHRVRKLSPRPAYVLLASIFLLAGLVFISEAGATGGDFRRVDFVASGPLTYDHSTGGGAYDDRTIGNANDVVEQLEGGDFACGDIITFLIAVEMEQVTVDAVQVAEFDVSFLADSTGQSGAAIGDIVNVAVNYGVVSGGDGPGGTDSGISDDGGSTATLVSEMLTGPLFMMGSELLGTIRVDDLEAGEQIVLRIDVQLFCDPGSRPTGNLQGALEDGRVVSPDPDTINTGQQTIPFLRVGEIAGANEPLVTIEKTVTSEDGTCGVDDVEELMVETGDTVKYCYVITNLGTAPLFDVELIDDNGTPGDPGDDFTVTLSGLQDLDGEGDLGDLEAGGTATGEALVTVTMAGTIVNTACVTGNNGAPGGGNEELMECDTATVIAEDPPNGPPVCDANGPYQMECEGTTTSIPLDGTGSSDPDDDDLTFRWTSDCPGAEFDDPNSATPTLTLDSTDCFVMCNVTLTVSDGINEPVQCQTTVTVSDTTDPEIECPLDVTVECTDPNGVVVEYDDPIAMDVCDPNVMVECDPPSGSVFPPGTTEVTCTATDCGGNTAECTFDVIVEDTMPPEIECPDDVVIEVSDVPAAPLDFEVTVNDACDTDPVVVCDPPPGTVFPPGDTIVICMAMDASGNTEVCDFTVRVLPCVNFDESTLGPVPDGTLITNQYLPLGVLVTGQSDTGVPGAVARVPGPPGSTTNDLIPVTPPNYLQTSSGATDSDSGMIMFDFVDPETGDPRPISFLQMSFLDIEDSGSGPGGRGRSRLRALDAQGNTLEHVVIPAGPDANVFQATIGDPDGPLAIFSALTIIGDQDDSGGVDEMCFFPTGTALTSRLLSPLTEISLGSTLILHRIEHLRSEESMSVRFELVGAPSLRRPGRVLVGPELLSLTGETSLIGPTEFSIQIPPDQTQFIGRDVHFIARYRHPSTEAILSEAIFSIRIVE